MANENNFFINAGNPLLESDGASVDEIMQDIKRLNAQKAERSKQLAALKEAAETKQEETPRREEQAQKQPSLWSLIDTELEPLSDSQYNLLVEDETYVANANKLQDYVREAIEYLAKPIVESMPAGKQLLETQLALIKGKKQDVINRSNKEMELFSKFKTASANNPELTYADFIKTHSDK